MIVSKIHSIQEGSKIATADYIRRHPELKAQILVYIERVLLEEPADLQLFAAQHFSPNN